MPDERGAAGASGGRLARPAVVFSALGLLLLLAVLLNPQPPSGAGDSRLTTHSAGARGARGLYDVAQRLGRRPRRLEAPLPARPAADAVYAVLAPTRPLGDAEIRRLLDAVRAGAGLLVVPDRGSALADSLGVRVSSTGGTVPAPPRPACPDGAPGPQGITWYDGQIHSWWLTPRRPLPADSAVFVRVWRAPVRPRPATRAGGGGDAEDEEVPGDSVRSPAALGFTLGRGRVVVVADPDLLRNDVIRVCRWGAGVAAVRMLEWLDGGRTPGAPRPLVFDEYHHGYGRRSGAGESVWRAAWGAPAGRLVVQGVAAALVLLLALGPRPLAPRSRARVQRRSPLEHVGALARAYEQVGATRTATALLARGVRRRHGGYVRARAQPRDGDDRGDRGDADFLAAVAARRPALTSDVERVRAALAAPTTPAGLLEVGQAVARIDEALRE